MNEIQIKGVDELPGVEYSGHVGFDVVFGVFNDQIDAFDNDLFGEVAAEEPEELVVVEAVPLVVLKFENFDEIVEETDSVECGLVKGGEGFEQDMLALVALGKELRNGLLRW